ncbi:hypothetical protein Vqi01_27150 [Micromonospora qiuiae]|uniref:Uncharacterized protein n=1 Tax=Micromonospora qiuiae TaxID=502268 RepID=A0ABQ4JBM3_9ACTN|nr:hypothetical protein [Micromonospora qiuiae]GIJ27553.1 hypothetical protein Vqi01_27150 [Micromonospora qiuiae]
MSYQTFFREAVGEIPPTSIDVEQVIRRQRRRHRLNRTGLAAMVGAAVLGVTVPLAIAGGSGPDLPALSPSPSLSAQSARTPRPEPGATFSATDLAVFAALAREAPDVEWITEGWPSDGDLVMWHPVDSAKLYFGQGPIRAGERTGYFKLQLQQDWDRRVAFCNAEKSQENGCVNSTGPAGEKIQTWSNQAPITSSDKNRMLHGKPAAPTSDRFSTHYGVAVERPDGTFLIVSMSADGENSPLTLAQLTAVALNSAITLG